jgi:hypothetical protein
MFFVSNCMGLAFPNNGQCDMAAAPKGNQELGARVNSATTSALPSRNAVWIFHLI